MASWYYMKEGQKLGPFSGTQFRRLVVHGELRETDPVWTEGLEQWVPAARVSGLFLGETLLNPPPPPPPPSTAPSPVEAIEFAEETPLRRAAHRVAEPAQAQPVHARHWSVVVMLLITALLLAADTAARLFINRTSPSAPSWAVAGIQQPTTKPAPVPTTQELSSTPTQPRPPTAPEAQVAAATVPVEAPDPPPPAVVPATAPAVPLPPASESLPQDGYATRDDAVQAYFKDVLAKTKSTDARLGAAGIYPAYVARNKPSPYLFTYVVTVRMRVATSPTTAGFRTVRANCEGLITRNAQGHWNVTPGSLDDLKFQLKYGFRHARVVDEAAQ